MKFTNLPKHHAILIVNNERQTISTELFTELKKLSPIHTFFNQTVLDIGIARDIIIWAQTPYNEEKIALISFHTIGLEAQNALLKILEEPRLGIRFILITSNKTNLIDTILSRVLVIEEKENNEMLTHAEIFLNTSHGLRIKLPYIVDILSRVDEEDRKDRESVRTFILTLSTVLKNENIGPRYIKETLEVASYVSDPSTSGKALLEYLSLLLPQSSV